MEKNWIASHSQPARLLSKANLWLAFSLAAFTLSGCVTINIYFPAAAAEKAADKIIDEVWQIQKNTAEPSNKSAAPDAKTNEPATKGAK